MPQNAAIAYRTQLINEIKLGTTGSGVPTEIPRLETLPWRAVPVRTSRRAARASTCTTAGA
jgi:hypothetical protein